MLRPVFFAIAAALATAALLAAPAQASKSQFSVMQDDGLLQSPNTAVRDAALDEMKALGTRTVKVAMVWRNVAPNAEGSSKPAGFNGADPTAYSGGFARYRALVDAINARGMTAWLILNTPAPKWAAPRNTTRQPGTYEPNAKEFGDFAEASGRLFPDVPIWSVLNEPNHEAFLWPQVKKTGIAYSAIMYRELVYEATAGLRNSGHANDTILFGGIVPRASKPVKGAKSVWPLTFLRHFFCLDTRLRPARGRLAKDLKCTGKFRRVSASGFAYHPYTGVRSPLSAAPTPEDALIGQLPRVYKILDRARALRRLSKSRIKLWNGEFGYQTYPPDPFGAKVGNVPAFLNLAEYISWKDPRVVNFQQYQLRDEPPDLSQPAGSLNRYRGFQSGLRYDDGRQKAGIYNAYELPVVVERTTSTRKVKVWGGVRASGGVPQLVDIQVKKGSKFQTVASVMTTGASGYFQTTVPISGAAGKTWRITSNGKSSRSTRPVRKVRPKR